MKKLIVLLIAVILLASCTNREHSDLEGNIETIDSKKLMLSSWVVYWDLEKGFKEISYIEPFVKEISYFAAYFDKDNRLFIPENINKAHIDSKAEGSNRVHYLSVVNDKLKEDGGSSLKDIETLYSVLGNRASRGAHVQDLINLCIENQYDGLEIDYEGLKKREDLWQYFIEFLEELYRELENRGLKMRIVLEPSTPMEKYNFPKGPEYVIMCYNLHGSHNGPGPKADIQFLKEMSQKSKSLPGKTTFALATGGFLWGSDGQVSSITEEKALELIAIHGLKPERDRNSKSLVFKYKENNIAYEGWFADEETLQGWVKTLTVYGNDKISIWRLGGNLKKTLINL